MDRKTCTEEQYQWLKRQVNEWCELGLIDSNHKHVILNRYQMTASNRINWQGILLISLGAILIGGGIILLFAHNWESLSKSSRTVLSILPLALAQIFTFYVVKYRKNVPGIVEAGAILVFFTIASSIALIGQTYHIYGDLERFLLTWVVLALPLIYLLQTHAVVILLAALISWLSIMSQNIYWLLYFLLAPYWYFNRANKEGMVFLWSLWIALAGFVLSFIFSLELGKTVLGDYVWPCLLSLAVFLYVIGKKVYGYHSIKFWSNPFSSLGSILIASFSLLLTWEEVWDIGHTVDRTIAWQEIAYIVVVVAMSITTVVFLVKDNKELTLSNMALITVLGLALFALLFPADRNHPSFAALMNVYVLAASLILMLEAIKQNRLLLLNGGLLWFSFLLIFRFFDSDIPFIYKGIVFIVLGSAFIAANIGFRKKQLAHIEQQAQKAQGGHS